MHAHVHNMHVRMCMYHAPLSGAVADERRGLLLPPNCHRPALRPPGLALPAEEPAYEPISWLPVIVGSVTVCWVLPYLILKAFEDPVHAEDVVRRISEVHIPSMVRSASGKLK